MTTDDKNGQAADPGKGAGRPDPDPTVLTTQALYREVSALQELIELRIEGQQRLMDEKFRGADLQFELVERGRVEQKADTKAAVDAALTAQKEAVKEQTASFEKSTNKSEATINELVKTMKESNDKSIEVIRRELGEVKDRVGAVENMKAGSQNAWKGIAAAIAVGATVITIALALIAFARPG